MATLSQIRELKTFCEQLHSDPNWREVFESLEQGVDDFEVNNVRFINSGSIDGIQCDDMLGDLYVLGCFNSWFLAGILDIDSEVIQAMQGAEALEALGKLIVSMGKLEELQEAYSRADGYGHHFNSYDGGEEELLFNGELYHVFDNH